MLTRISLALLVGALLLQITACGSSSDPNPQNLTQAQSQQLASEGFTEIAIATIDGLRSLETSCTSSPCTLSYTYECADGGSIAVAGSLTVSKSGGTDSASGTVNVTPSKCSDGTLVINGNPDVTVTSQVSDNGTTSTGTFTAQGNVGFSPVTSGQFPTGTCGVSNLMVSGSATDSTGDVTCTISGSICGQTVSTSCPSGVHL